MKVLFLLLLLLPAIVFPQRQDAKVLAYNVGFGGLTAGVGAVINKKADENWRRTFVRGFWQGSIGGALNYTSKKSLHLVYENENLAYTLPGRVLNAAGNSIIQNAAANEPFLKNWNFEYGWFRFDYRSRAKTRFGVRVLPLSVIGTVAALPQGRLDLPTTLLTGVVTFRSDELLSTLSGHQEGVNYGRVFIYNDEQSSKYYILSHEVIHEFQYRQHLVFNAYLQKPVARTNAPGLKKLFTKYVYPDISYFGLFYLAEGIEPSPHYYRNFYEFEAERLSTNCHVPVE